MNTAKTIEKQQDVFGITTEINQNEESTGGSNSAIKYSIRNSKSFGYKANIIGTLKGDNTKKEAEIIVPLKNLSNFWRTLDMRLINC